MEVRLPWPPRALWPNGRPHPMQRARLVKQHREWARLATLAVISHGLPDDFRLGDTYRLHITAHPKRRPQGGATAFDDDGLVGACKAYRDGIADALRVNDRRFATQPVQRGESVPGGDVIIRIEVEA